MSVLADELNNDPLNRQYAQMSDAEAAADLNTEYRTVRRQTFASERTVIWAFTGSEAGKGEAVLQAFEAAAGDADNPNKDIYARAKRWMVPSEQGVDLSLDDTRSLVDGLKPYLTNDYSDSEAESMIAAVKGLADYTVSRAEELGLGTVRTGDVERAR